LRCLLTNGYPAERAEASLSLSLSISFPGRKNANHMHARVGTHARIPTPLYPLAKEDYSETRWKLHRKVGKEDRSSPSPASFHLRSFYF
jgi:hypothetical protein